MEKELKFLLYNNDSKKIYIDSLIKKESIWLTQKINSDFNKFSKKLLEKRWGKIYE